MFWVMIAALLFFQNFSFTFVSRARNSGSLKRHMIAAVISNSVWFATQVAALGPMIEIVTGKKGLWAAVIWSLWYTLWTVAGSLAAHWWALRSERGQAQVGASKRRAEISPEEWEWVKRSITPKPERSSDSDYD